MNYKVYNNVKRNFLSTFKHQEVTEIYRIFVKYLNDKYPLIYNYKTKIEKKFQLKQMLGYIEI